jgi:hypothetical protein
MRKTVNARVKFRRDRLGRQPFEASHQRVREAMQPVSVRHDILALHIIQNLADLCGRILMVIEKRNELPDGPLEIDVVLPERVVRIDKERLGAVGRWTGHDDG